MAGRMRIICFVVCLIAGLLVFVPLQAQIYLDLSGGVVVPIGEMNDYWGMGPGFSGSILYQVTPFVSVGANFGYSKMGFDDGSYRDEMSEPDAFDISGGDLSVFNACGELRIHAGAMEKAFVFGGAGLGLFNIGRSDLTLGTKPEFSDDGVNKLGGFINAGVVVPLMPLVKLGVKGQYTLYSIDDDKAFPELENTRNYFTVMGVLIIGLD